MAVVISPTTSPMSFSDKDAYNTIISVLTARMWRCKDTGSLPSFEVIASLIKAATAEFDKEPSLLDLKGDWVVVGDIHGNIDDLLRIFERGGYPPAKKYLFLGDYVDRGDNSVEVILLLYSLKTLFPDHIKLIRGNHECESITSVYGFRRECCSYLSARLYRKIVKSFSSLPFAAILNNTYLCVHGGISPDLDSIENISDIPKPMLSADSDIANDLVWSDPCADVSGFVESDRGTGYLFSGAVLKKFLKSNGLKMLIRSHESCDRGFAKPIKRCLTVFSNTDYCGLNNKAAVAVVNESGEYSIETFKPLSERELRNRRVLVPHWLIDEMSGLKTPIQQPLVVNPLVEVVGL